MKRAFALLAVAALNMNVWSQQDPIIMRVNGKEITRSEFEYSYNKNNSERSLDKKTLSEYAQLFVDFKLKVAAAEELRLDTLSSFRNEFKGYRDQQAQEYLVDDSFIEKEARRVYDATKQNIGEAGLIRTAHILIRIPQDADQLTQERAKSRMDSIYNVLQNGGEFSQLATRFSEDPGSARQGGMLPWLYAKQIYPEFANAAYSLNVNEISKPFLSPAGIHIVKMLERKQLEPFEEQRDDIYAFLERNGVRSRAIEAKRDFLFKEYGGAIKLEEVLAYEDSQLETKYPEFGHLMQEYHDGLLLFEVSNLCVWDKAAQDEDGLQKYFKKHKSDYSWDAPRYKGAVLHCANKDVAKQLKKKLKKMPEEQWKSYIQTEFNKDSVQLVRMEKGLYKIGDNAYVDNLAFKQGELKPLKNYPYPVLLGKVLKKGPESYKDVRGALTADYQNKLEVEWIKELRDKYTVEINEEVLETVNNKR